MKTRIRTGPSVQAISSGVLWVKDFGVLFRFSL